jgi:hypothetical protein
MRWFVALAGLALFSHFPDAPAGDHPWLDRFVQRAPCPRNPPEHSMERAGYPQSVKSHAVPSVTRYDHAGYIGGASVCNNCLRARGPGSATGPVTTGTFGTDYGGVHAHLGRVFLAPSYDPSCGHPIYLSYRAEGPRVPDPLALRPFRNAVLAAHEATGCGHAEGGHCEGGHGGEAGHALEGGEGKGGH